MRNMSWSVLICFLFSFGFVSVANAKIDCMYEHVKDSKPERNLSSFELVIMESMLPSILDQIKTENDVEYAKLIKGKALIYSGMAWVYHFGKANIPRNDQKALKWFKMAADIDKDYAVCMAEVGERFLTGNGEVKNKHKGLIWLKEAASYGSESQVLLGKIYYKGIGMPSDKLQAAYWFEKAANSNNSYAQMKIGSMYYNGEGISKNLAKSYFWIKKVAINTENANHQYTIGLMNFYGSGVKKNHERAAYWFGLASDQGHPEAMYRLAILLYDSNRTKDNERADDLIRRSAKLGNKDAKKLLKNNAR